MRVVGRVAHNSKNNNNNFRISLYENLYLGHCDYIIIKKAFCEAV